MGSIQFTINEVVEVSYVNCNFEWEMFVARALWENPFDLVVGAVIHGAAVSSYDGVA